MRRLNFDFIPGPVRRWAPPVIGIPFMLAWAAWGGEAVTYILFTHHLFFAAAIGLLIGPLLETFGARSTQGKVKLSRSKIPAGTRPRAVPTAVLRVGSPLPAEARRQRTRPPRAQPERAPTSAAARTVDERLALLRKQKAAVESNIARLTKDTEHTLGSG